jgi:hypothetical protein
MNDPKLKRIAAVVGRVQFGIHIVESADLVIAFWDGNSCGTRSALAHADKVGVPVEVHHPDGTVTE